jgi:nucleoside-diphosphate-sugar epimerase
VATHFVTGGTGVVGRVLIEDLVADGHTVLALGRTGNALRELVETGAEPVFGNLSKPGTWQHDAAQADVVWHLGLPRVAPPLRRLRVRRDAKQAWRDAHHLGELLDDDRPIILASNVLVWGDRGTELVHEDDEPNPVAMGHWSLAAEQALAGPQLRTVRLGWIYGHTGMFSGVITAVRRRQYRIVGDGQNVMPLISARDAVRALRTAQGAPTGVYAAVEPASPTQEALIHRICAAVGAPRPDRIPSWMASLSLGAAMADALGASIDVDARRLADLGWTPADSWRESLVAITRPGAQSP